jgi:hypothetical protein
MTDRDATLDTLLDLAGQIFVVDAGGAHWVKFEVRRIEPTPEKPHGLDYSLTLHGPSGERLVGFDNAHAVKAQAGPGGKRAAWDTSTGCERSAPTTTPTQPPCSGISGAWWMMC